MLWRLVNGVAERIGQRIECCFLTIETTPLGLGLGRCLCLHRFLRWLDGTARPDLLLRHWLREWGLRLTRLLRLGAGLPVAMDCAGREPEVLLVVRHLGVPPLTDCSLVFK